MLENLYQYYSFKVLRVTNFTMITEKTIILWKNVVLTHDQLNFYWSSKIKKYLIFPWTKRSEIFYRDPLIFVEKNGFVDH